MHGPIGDSWSMAFFDCPRGHRVRKETRVLQHGPDFTGCYFPSNRYEEAGSSSPDRVAGNNNRGTTLRCQVRSFPCLAGWASRSQSAFSSRHFMLRDETHQYTDGNRMVNWG